MHNRFWIHAEMDFREKGSLLNHSFSIISFYWIFHTILLWRINITRNCTIVAKEREKRGKKSEFQGKNSNWNESKFSHHNALVWTWRHLKIPRISEEKQNNKIAFTILNQTGTTRRIRIKTKQFIEFLIGIDLTIGIK